MSNGETIEQRHREVAAAGLGGTDARTQKVREDILAGRSDDHPGVQAAAFYEEQGMVGADDMLKAGERASALWPKTLPAAYALVSALTARVEDIHSADEVWKTILSMPQERSFRDDFLVIAQRTIVARLHAKGVDKEEIASIIPVTHIA